jgi:tetratricopeptide (TPR) repeat protein
MMLTALLIGENDNQSFQIGKSQLFEGTFLRWGSEAEEHLLDLTDDSNDSAYIWNRLGNLYHVGGRPELAAAAFEKSILIDPAQIESHFTMAGFLMDLDEWERAAYHYRKMLVHARTYDRLNPQQLRECLTNGLMEAMFIHMETEQRIPFIPSKEEIDKVYGRNAGKEGPRTLRMIDLDLDTRDPKSFYPLAEFYMGSKVKQKTTLKSKIKGKRENRNPMFRSLSPAEKNKKVRVKGQLKKVRKKKKKK